MSEPLLKVESLSKNFDRLPVLRDVSFQVDKGEVIGLVGRQGAGKSTLLHLLGGAIPASSGTINYLGKSRRFFNRLEA
ncbi:MAG TPA: ATP-binding cassette domain-containing protein, partial [Anaerolineales bacterium]|nr:ATP-binding cassette domain-containing protein [Anaerolineales bacterium]